MWVIPGVIKLFNKLELIHFIAHISCLISLIAYQCAHYLHLGETVQERNSKNPWRSQR